jgi:hypothetical protein
MSAPSRRSARMLSASRCCRCGRSVHADRALPVAYIVERAGHGAQGDPATERSSKVPMKQPAHFIDFVSKGWIEWLKASSSE